MSLLSPEILQRHLSNKKISACKSRHTRVHTLYIWLTMHYVVKINCMFIGMCLSWQWLRAIKVEKKLLFELPCIFFFAHPQKSIGCILSYFVAKLLNLCILTWHIQLWLCILLGFGFAYPFRFLITWPDYCLYLGGTTRKYNILVGYGTVSYGSLIAISFSLSTPSLPHRLYLQNSTNLLSGGAKILINFVSGI